jgi:hypothetical protein
MTDFGAAYTAEWHLYKVHRQTWADEYEVGRLVSVSLNRDSDGDAPEIDSGTLGIEGPAGFEWESGYYRLAMRAIQRGVERVDVMTLLCESDGGTVDRGVDLKSVTGRSVLHPAATTYTTLGDYAAAGEDGAQKAARMLRAAIAAPVSVEGSFALRDAYVFSPNASVLSSVWALLKAANFCMWPDGRGVVHIAPLPTQPVLTLDRANARLVDPDVSHSLDISGIPNRYTADDDGVRVTVSNETGSKASYDQRGYWVDAGTDSPAPLDGESLDAYAARMLSEKSIAKDSRTYGRRFWPDVHPFMVVQGSMPSVKLDGLLRVESQAIDCSHGIQVTETAYKEVQMWR